jgi:hypothetical protein
MEFRELKSFSEKIDKISSLDDLVLLQMELMENPEKGDLIRGAGGARKVRMRIGGKGKSGGARVIYYYQVSDCMILFIHAFAKNEKANISDKEKKEIAAFIKRVKA